MCLFVQSVLQYNLCRVLNDPTGEQTRPLVVRRANMRKPASAIMAMSGNPAASMFSSHNHGSSASNAALMAGAGPSGLMHSSAVGLAGGHGAAGAGPGLASSGSLGGVMDLNGMGSGGISLGSFAGAEVPMHVQPMAAHNVQVMAYSTVCWDGTKYCMYRMSSLAFLMVVVCCFVSTARGLKLRVIQLH